jgi:hypothetical protein
VPDELRFKKSDKTELVSDEQPSDNPEFLNSPELSNSPESLNSPLPVEAHDPVHGSSHQPAGLDHAEVQRVASPLPSSPMPSPAKEAHVLKGLARPETTIAIMVLLLLGGFKILEYSMASSDHILMSLAVNLVAQTLLLFGWNATKPLLVQEGNNEAPYKNPIVMLIMSLATLGCIVCFFLVLKTMVEGNAAAIDLIQLAAVLGWIMVFIKFYFRSRKDDWHTFTAMNPALLWLYKILDKLFGS